VCCDEALQSDHLMITYGYGRNKTSVRVLPCGQTCSAWFTECALQQQQPLALLA
jgi:hypothetical protein